MDRGSARVAYVLGALPLLWIACVTVRGGGLGSGGGGGASGGSGGVGGSGADTGWCEFDCGYDHPCYQAIEDGFVPINPTPAYTDLIACACDLCADVCADFCQGGSALGPCKVCAVDPGTCEAEVVACYADNL